MLLTYSKNPKRDDINHVGWFMREADQKELFAAEGEAPVEILHKSWAQSSDPYLFYWNNVPTFVCGCVKGPEGLGIPWMVATDHWEEIPNKKLWKLSCMFIERWLSDHNLLTNLVDSRNGRARDWLKRLGATEEEILPYGPLKLPFIRFEIK